MVWLQSALACLALGGVGQTELLEFSAQWCGPCRQMQPIVDGMAARGLPVRKVDFDRDKALATRYGVTAIPCFIMLVDGREVDRVVGATTQARLEKMVSMAGPKPAAAPLPPSVPMPGQPSRDPLPVAAPSVAPGPHREQLAAVGESLAAGNDMAKICLASTVRLRIEDTSGNSVGTGTIIDTRNGEALILTCGHVFRDSKGTGRIQVDMFGPGAPKGLGGELVGYDLKRDIGLISVRPGVPVLAARLAPPDHRSQRGDVVISVGCDNGREPTAVRTQVNGTDKYLGPENNFSGPTNIQVGGQPCEGRSGGGLFTSEGLVIGVCNAADPADNEGLYAGVGSIHTELARLGLSELVLTGASAATGRAALASAGPPPMSGAMPSPTAMESPAELGSRVVSTSADGARGKLAGPISGTDLTSAEQAMLTKLRAQAAGAEVICIVRPLHDPRGKSEIIVLDRASPEFLRQLSADQQSQQARHLTSLDTKKKAHAAPPVVLTSDRRLPDAGQPVRR